MTEIIRIPNIEKYTQEIVNGVLILTPIKEYITEEELNNLDLKGSKILEHTIKNGAQIVSQLEKRWLFVLINIWKSMPAQKILQNTTFNFKLTNENGLNGYVWRNEINMSVQNKETKSAIKEIIHMVKVNKYTIELSVKLKTERIIHFKIENNR